MLGDPALAVQKESGRETRDPSAAPLHSHWRVRFGCRVWVGRLRFGRGNVPAGITLARLQEPARAQRKSGRSLVDLLPPPSLAGTRGVTADRSGLD
jgi:hypothetical protein